MSKSNLQELEREQLDAAVDKMELARSAFWQAQTKTLEPARSRAEQAERVEEAFALWGMYKLHLSIVKGLKATRTVRRRTENYGG